MWKRAYAVAVLLATASASAMDERDHAEDGAAPASSIIVRVATAILPIRSSASRLICTSRHIGVLGREKIHRRCFVGEPREEDTVLGLVYDALKGGNGTASSHSVRTASDMPADRAAAGGLQYGPASARSGATMSGGAMKLRQRAIPRFQAEVFVGGSGSSLNGAVNTFAVVALLIGLFLTFFGYRVFQVLIFLTGFIPGCMVGIAVAGFDNSTEIASDNVGVGATLMIIFVGLASGVAFGIITYMFYLLTVCCLGMQCGAVGGFIFVSLIFLADLNPPVSIAYLIVLYCAVGCGVYATKIVRVAVIIATSAIGSILSNAAFLSFSGGCYVTETDNSGFSQCDFGGTLTILALCIVALAIGGCAVQFRVTGNGNYHKQFTEGQSRDRGSGETRVQVEVRNQYAATNRPNPAFGAAAGGAAPGQPHQKYTQAAAPQQPRPVQQPQQPQQMQQPQQHGPAYHQQYVAPTGAGGPPQQHGPGYREQEMVPTAAGRQPQQAFMQGAQPQSPVVSPHHVQPTPQA